MANGSKKGNTSPAALRGYILEVVLVNLLRKNGYSLVTEAAEQNEIIGCRNKSRIKVKGNEIGLIELRGRGTWHQIDCPCNYNLMTPFMYPIRLIGEVKFYKNEVQKNKIREFIGVLKDIQENYIVYENDNTSKDDTGYLLEPRYLEVGAFFAANGFQEEAENLAYAHGVKTISYKNNVILAELKKIIEEITADQNNVNYINKIGRGYFLKELDYLLSGEDNPTKTAEFMEVTVDQKINQGFDEPLNRIKAAMQKIECSFFAMTDSGITLHFLSTAKFPNDLFATEDIAICKVHYSGDEYWLTFDKRPGAKYYFEPPKQLIKAVNTSETAAIKAKGEIFQRLICHRTIDGKRRVLEFQINKKWIEKLNEKN